MKNKFFKKVSLGIILIMVLGILFVGCGGTVVPPPPPPPACTLTVYSQWFSCYGYVWVNGASTGQWIDFNGAVTIQGLSAGTVAYVQIVDNAGFFSHTEIKPLVSGNNIVIFDYWW
jgi:hypothetical protein